MQNELLADDANKRTDLARSRDGVRTLIEATAGDLERSARYRDIFRPLGLSDELRVALRTRGAFFPYMRLHREGPDGFSAAEAGFVGRIAPYLAEGIRLGLLVRDAVMERADAPGLVLLADDGTLVGNNGPAHVWLDELRDPAADRLLPIELYAVVAELRGAADSSAPPPRLRVRTRAGRWVVIHASWLGSQRGQTAAVIIEPAPAIEIAPLLMAAYGLTPRERAVTGLVCSGLSTREVAARLHLAEHTVQDHLKSVFHEDWRAQPARARRHSSSARSTCRAPAPASTSTRQGSSAPITRSRPGAPHRSRRRDDRLHAVAQAELGEDVPDCVFTVASPTTSSRAISALEQPRASRRSTSRSRSVSSCERRGGSHAADGERGELLDQPPGDGGREQRVAAPRRRASPRSAPRAARP